MNSKRYIISENYLRAQQAVIEKAKKDLEAISDSINAFQVHGVLDEDTLLNLIDIAARDIKNALATITLPF